jgi:NHL repeat
MRVSLAPLHLRSGSMAQSRSRDAPALLAAHGPRVVLGGSADEDGLARPIAPGPSALFGPRGACLGGDAGPLFVSDTGHHRLLIWHRSPEEDHRPADLLIGQPDFQREGRNGKGEVGSATFNVPTGVCAADGVLCVADAWNHRVLIWHGYPDATNRPADIVLGQADFDGGLANRGSDAPRADTLHWCYGIAIADGRLIVADTGNRRVLIWNEVPGTSGAPADCVLGQSDFTTRDENAGVGAGAVGMRWPHGIAVTNGALLVSDAGNNRVMVWRSWPRANGAPCDFVLGQADAMRLDHNRCAYYPDAGAMNMPYGLGVADGRLIVADTANSRLLGFDLDGLAMGAGASRLAGQRAFEDKGDNRWGAPERDSLCWPYGVWASARTLVVADSGNNRVLLWEVAA